MSLFELCIRRPVLSTVLSLLVLVIGAISYTRLAVREYPRIDEPIVSVNTTYPGASAEVIESQVTKMLEDSLAGIEGVELMTSQSRSERSQINVRFRITRDPDSAAADVRDKVARVRARLPETVDEPVIAKVEADAFPIIWMAVEAGDRTPLEASDYLTRYMKPRLSVLPGAADVRIFGERVTSMRINVDRDRLAGYGLTAQDVEDALRRQNVETAVGPHRIGAARIHRRRDDRRQHARAVRQIDRRQRQGLSGAHARRRGIAVGAVDERVISRYNGKPSINIGLIKQAVANPLDLSKAVRAELAKINANLPPGMSINVSYDSSVFIDRSITSVFTTITEAVLLVVLVIFFFLRSLRATLIPIVTIPVSLVGAFALMYAFGFTINTLTLLAMVLAIGLVVDDAIVVLENIYRHIEAGMERVAAAVKGIKEIGFAVVAMTLTLTAVFAPLAFATGRTGRLFIEFALTLAGAVLVSGFVALTLVADDVQQAAEARGEARPDLHDDRRLAYGADQRLCAVARLAARASLDRRGGVVRHCWASARCSSRCCAPSWRRSRIAASYSAACSRRRARRPSTRRSSCGRSRAFLRRFRKLRRTTRSPGFRRSTSAPASAPEAVGRAHAQAAGDRARAESAIPDACPASSALRSIRRRSASRSARCRSNTSSWRRCRMPSLIASRRSSSPKSRSTGIVQNPQSDLRLNTPELRVDINRDKLGDLGIPVETVGRTLQTMLGGRQITRFKRDGEQYDVIVQVAPRDRSRPNDISEIYVRARDGSMVQLANVVNVLEGVSPSSLNHFQRLRAVTITATLAPGYTIGDALKMMDETAQRGAAAGCADRSERPVARVSRCARQLLSDVGAGADLHLPGAVRAVRKLRRSVRHHAVGAAVDGRCAVRAVGHRRHLEHLQPDRGDHLGRVDHQARHLDRRVREPAAGARRAVVRRDSSVGGVAAAADPDDDRRDGARRAAARAVIRRRRREPHSDRLGHRRRTDVRNVADAVRRADDVHADGAGPGQVDGIASPRAARDGGERRGVSCRGS